MKKNIIALALMATLWACKNQKNGEIAPTSEIESVTDSAAKIIKTADMRFRVKNVQQTKEELSKRIKEKGGSIVEFSIQSNLIETAKIKQSTDSLKEITAYQTEGYLVAKVPADMLDEFTNTAAKMAIFVNNSHMKMDDQSIAYLNNKLKVENRVEAVQHLNKVATKKSPNVESALMIKDDVVDRKIENLVINERVKYSTITLNFYQDNTVKTMVVANDQVSDFKPNFGSRLWLNLINGWSLFKEIILAMANLWMLFVLGIGVFFALRYYAKKSKKVAVRPDMMRA